MFPLGTALLPGMALPLRLFEPRYLQLYADVIDAGREFGVVLIERGIESRDDNPTFHVGSLARIVGSGINDDGTIGLLTIGMSRIRISEWLPSAPYPVAMVTDLDDDPLSEEGVASLRTATDDLLRLFALAGDLGSDMETVAPTLSDDPARAVYDLAQLAGLQELDRQRILEAPTSDARASLVHDLIIETIDLIRLQLETGDPWPPPAGQA